MRSRPPPLSALLNHRRRRSGLRGFPLAPLSESVCPTSRSASARLTWPFRHPVVLTVRLMVLTLGLIMEKTRNLARTRDRILKAALAEFAANGLAGARCSEIAGRAGVNKRVLFYCFGSEESL